MRYLRHGPDDRRWKFPEAVGSRRIQSYRGLITLTQASDDGAKVTMRDVARAAGVSLATASRSLNGRSDVHPDTRRRVRAAAESLGFPGRRRGQVGRRTVGLLTSDPGGRFSMAVLTGAEDALGAGEIDVLLCATRNDPIRERHYVRSLVERQVDGIIVVAEWTNPRPPLPESVDIPVVYAFAPSERAGDLSFVPDDAHGGRLAADHLLSLGRSRLAHVTGPEDWLSARDRAAGVGQAVSAAGTSLVQPALFGPDWTQRWGRVAARMVLAAHPDVDGIVCGSDQIAVGVIDGLRAEGRSVPDDVSVVGYDNWEVFSTDSRPPLTTVDMNLQPLGREAALALVDQPDLGGSAPYRQPARLVVRESTAPRGA